MSFRSLNSVAVLTLLAVPVLSHAQSQTSANEDERLEALIRESETVYVPKSTVTIGFRALNSGPKTSFGNLGSVPNTNAIIPASNTTTGRTYHNGVVGIDAVRADEKDAPTSGGRYQTYTTATDTVPAVQTGDYLSYVSGQTRVWGYSDESQATARPGYIAMSNYSASSNGGAAYKEQGLSTGLEVQFERRLTSASRRFQVSLIAGLSLSSINNKVSGSVLSNLRTQTDYYQLPGGVAPALDATTGVYSAPDVDVVALSDTLSINYENTVTLSQTQDPVSGDTTLTDGTTVDGNWQVKGNYFLVRLGPLVRTQLSERFGLSASAGVAGAYAGTRYTATESFSVPDVATPITTSASSDKSKFLNGYYADFNVEFTANERTGFYGGVTAQQLGDYSQTLGDRTATIDIGSSVGVRGGISIKF